MRLDLFDLSPACIVSRQFHPMRLNSDKACVPAIGQSNIGQDLTAPGRAAPHHLTLFKHKLLAVGN